MKRYALPLGILGVIVVLLALVFISGSKAPDYTGGNATEPPLSEEWVRGDTNAAVKLVEYSDFQCPACAAYQPLLKELLARYATSSLAFVYRHYPLTQIHANADLAARAAEAAGKQGKFWEMHDILFERQLQWDKLLDPEDRFSEYASELGLNAEQFKNDMASDEVRRLVADDYQRGQRIGVAGTPTFVLNGQKFGQNPGSLAEFEAILNSVLGR